MRLVSWNVNGIRSVHKKGFFQWLASCGADVVGLQEVRAPLTEIPADLQKPDGWHTHYVAAQRSGYSGVGLLCRREPDHIETSIGDPMFDNEGRVQLAHYGDLVVANVYFPNGQGKNGDNSRIPYKLAFYRQLYDVLGELQKKGKYVAVMGDFNTAHQEIDLARPKQNVKSSGFCPEEREELDRWIRTGYVDTFRMFDKSPEKYTWWTPWANSRARNVGWRIDYVLVSQNLAPKVKNAFIWADVMGSDHCPVGVDLEISS